MELSAAIEAFSYLESYKLKATSYKLFSDSQLSHKRHHQMDLRLAEKRVGHKDKR